MARATIIDRVIAGMERKAATGAWTAGSHPFGYTGEKDPATGKGTGRLLPNDHAPLVPIIFKLYTRRRLGSAAIAAWLNEHGHRTRTGRPWSSTTVRGVLRNRAYLGEVTFRGQRYNADHQPLITPDVFDTAQALLAERGEDRAARRSNPSAYLLAGLVHCARCGKRFIGTAATGNRYRYAYYTCFSRLRYGPKTCNADRLPADELETTILTALLDTYEHTSFIDDALQATADRLADDRHRGQKALDTVNAEIHEVEQAIQRYLLAFEAGTLPERVCGDRLRELGTTVARLRATRDQLIQRLETTRLATPTGDELAALRARIRDVIANGSIAARKALLRAVVHEIRVDARDHIQPVFRVPVSGSSTALTTDTPENTEVHDPKVRALGGDVDPIDHNPNTPPPATPLVSGPTIRLPGHHAKIRRDGYIGHRRGGPATRSG